MNEGKKKKSLWKKVVIAIIAVFVFIFIVGLFSDGETDNVGTGSDSESETTQNITMKDDENENSNKDKPNETIQNDTRYRIGETVTFRTDNGGEINVTLTDWGSTYDNLSGTVLYVSYMIENIGKERTGLFDVYADDYSIEKTWIPDKADASNATLSGGRKTNGTFCAEINPDNATVIEVECGDSVFVLKDNRSAVMSNENSLDETDIPSDIKVDSEPIEKNELSGHYGGMMGQSVIYLSIYSSPEEGEISIGNAEIYVEGGQYSYNGQIAEIKANVYQVATDTGEKVLLTASMYEDTVMLHLYVDGKCIEEYLLLEHYES